MRVADSGYAPALGKHSSQLLPKEEKAAPAYPDK